MATHKAEDVKIRIQGISEVVPATMITAEYIGLIMSVALYYGDERTRHAARVKGVTHAAGAAPGSIITAVQFIDGYTVTIATE